MISYNLVFQNRAMDKDENAEIALCCASWQFFGHRAPDNKFVFIPQAFSGSLAPVAVCLCQTPSNTRISPWKWCHMMPLLGLSSIFQGLFVSPLDSSHLRRGKKATLLQVHQRLSDLQWRCRCLRVEACKGDKDSLTLDVSGQDRTPQSSTVRSSLREVSFILTAPWLQETTKNEEKITGQSRTRMILCRYSCNNSIPESGNFGLTVANRVLVACLSIEPIWMEFLPDFRSCCNNQYFFCFCLRPGDLDDCWLPTVTCSLLLWGAVQWNASTKLQCCARFMSLSNPCVTFVILHCDENPVLSMGS